MTYTAEDFWHLDPFIEGNLTLGIPGITTHGAGHIGVGGQIGEVSLSLVRQQTRYLEPNKQ